jgi:hypothetical protein
MFVSQIFDECAEILGTTINEKVFRKISQAVQTLLEAGHWTHSTAEIDICTGWDKMSVVLPRGVDTPLAVNVDGSPLYFRNRLFQYHINKGGRFNPVTWAWDDRGYTATMMDIIQPSQLVAVAELDNDAGKILRILGTNSQNLPLRSQLENGIGVDGILVKIHSQSDYPLGVILPDSETVETRKVAIEPISFFKSFGPHTLSSGEGVNIQNTSGVIPVPLSNGDVLYVGVVDSETIQLYRDQINATLGSYPIILQSIVGAGTLRIRDSKPSQVVTALSFSGTPIISLSAANPIAFPAGQALPAPLKEKVTYFGNLINGTSMEIYESLSDAQNSTNPVYTTGTTDTILVDLRKEIVPETKLTFSLEHYFLQGDQVQVFTSGGTLPNPLIANANYFVNIIDSFTITLHESQADALASTPTSAVNPVELIDAGTGTNFVVKLIASSFRSGETSQVTAPGLNISTPSGSGASFQAVVTGSVRAVQVTAQGNGYATVPSVTFSDPPDPPIGSNQQAVTATGYAIINTTSTKLEQIIITNPGLGYTDPPAITIAAPTGGSPAQATASATIQTSFVSYFTKISGGSGYRQSPQVQISGGGGSGATAQAVVNNSVIDLVSISVSGTTATATTSLPHGFNKNSIVTLLNCQPAVPFNGDKTVLTVPTLSTNVTIARSDLINTTRAIVTSSTPHNYSTGQIVEIVGAAQAQYNGTFSITVINPTQFYYTVTGSPATPATGTIQALVPNPAGLTFTFAVPSGTPNATTAGEVFSGEVVGLNIITSGTGYTSSPAVVLTPSTGVFVEFSSTGTLPNPIVSGTAYRAEAPLDTNSGVFTIKNADFSKFNLTGGGSGTFYTVLSRSFGVSFTNRWRGDFSNIPSGQGIYFGTDFQLPTTNPPIDNGVTQYFLTKISDRVAQIAEVDNDLIKVVSFGTGQTYFALRYPVRSLPYNNLIKPDSVNYLQDDEIVSFRSSGTLPSPILEAVSYKIKLVGNSVQIFDTNNNQIILGDGGTGQLILDIERTVAPQPSSKIVCSHSLFATGQAVSVRSANGDSLPSGLSAGVLYYVRRVDENSFELYTTKQSAQSGGVANIVKYLTPGNSAESEFYIDAIDEKVVVKTVSQIEKPITDGYVSLYAWDLGRSNDMTLIGRYHPSEINPQYRRIRIGKPCAWVRIAYRPSAPFITSIYDYIPIEHERAIIAAIHAVDMEDKDFAEQAARYWAIALNYLKNQQEYIDGHAMTPPQINNITYGDGTDVFIS